MLELIQFQEAPFDLNNFVSQQDLSVALRVLLSASSTVGRKPLHDCLQLPEEQGHKIDEFEKKIENMSLLMYSNNAKSLKVFMTDEANV